MSKIGTVKTAPVRSMPATSDLLDLLTSPACLLDESGHVLSLNSAWREFAGIATGGNGRLPWMQLIHSEDRYAALSRFQRENGAALDFECRLQSCGGGARWFQLSLSPLDVREPDAGNWLCTATDIDDLKRREFELQRRASMQTDMLDISVDCIKLIALDGTLIHMNRAGCHALGVPTDSAFGMTWLSLLPEDVRAVGEQAIAEAREGKFARFPGRSDVPGQAIQHWDNMLTPVIGAGGKSTAILCVSREVTGEREAQDSLRRSEERLSLATHVGGLGIWDYDIRGDELFCDDQWHRIMGRDPSEPIRSIAEFRPFIHPDDADAATEVGQTAAELLAAQRDYTTTFRIIRPNGDIRWVRSAACIQERDGAPRRAVGFVVDITDAWRGELALRDANRALEEEKTSLARQSLEDPLTGIANRRCLDSELARMCVRASEAGEPLSVCMIDVDYFKAYNDRYGHPAGDAALRKFAAALQAIARKSDFVARYGGEEFVLVLAGLRDPSPVLARFLEAVIALGIVHQGSPTGYMTASCGCRVFDRCNGVSPTSLLALADEALYQAKVDGRNRYVVHAP